MLMIEIRNLKKYYVSGWRKKRVTKALDGVDLSISKGTVYGLTGESGCGKTTLALLILRLMEPTSGAIRINGQDVLCMGKAALKRLRPKCQIIWQHPDTSLNPRMKLKDSILEPTRYHKRCARGDESTVLDRYCRLVELPQTLLDRYPHEVSGGENQRAVIARALTLDPELLIADEPTSSLDILVQAQLLDLLKRVQQELTITLIFISHDLQTIRYMCDEMAVMRRGKIVEEGACSQVLMEPRTPYARELVDNAFAPWRFA